MKDNILSQEEIEALLKNKEEGKEDDKNTKEEENKIEEPETTEPSITTISERNNKVDESQQIDLNMILDMPLRVSVCLGSKEIEIKDLLELNIGTLIEINRLLDEPVDICVNGEVVAKGEVVIAGESFGVNVIDIITPMERIEKLR